MKLLLPFILLLVMLGCASPYRTVYVSDEGDYYIEEQRVQSFYDEPGVLMYAGLGIYPWWITPYYPYAFTYYSPYFYPHYFSVWYPPGYYPFYGYHRGYWPSWYPPHRLRWSHYRDHRGRPVINPVPDLPGAGDEPLTGAALRRSLYSREDLYRTAPDPRKTGYRKSSPALPGASSKQIPTRRYRSAPPASSVTRAAPARAPSRSAPTSRRHSPAGKSLSRDKD